jgi:hypothetical protein
MRTYASIAISLTALVVAVLGSTPVGGAAWNQVVPRSSVGPLQLQEDAVRSRHVRNGSLLAADFRQGQLPRSPDIVWALVDRLGSLEAGHGAVASRRVGQPGSGLYTVTFNRSMLDCAVLATQRTSNNAYAAARPGGAGVNSVTVSLVATTTESRPGHAGFTVAAICKPPLVRSP